MSYPQDSDYVGVQYLDQASDLATPAAGRKKVYTKSGGLYMRDSAGTVVQFSTSAGGMADAVILAPTSSTRNVIQPTADHVPFATKRFNSGATSDLYQAQDETGSALFRINSAGQIIRQGAAGTSRSLFFNTAGNIRWEIAANATAEGGSDAGSNLIVNRYSDAGSLLDFALVVVRATGVMTTQVRDGVTSSVTNVQEIRHNSTGTPVAGFGSAYLFTGESSTTESREMGRILFLWDVATDASRTARGRATAYDTAERTCLEWSANGSAARIAFLGAAPVVRQTSGANLTNNVTSGGTDDTIANFTDLALYANDAATIRNDIYQLARKLKQCNDALRTYGLLT